MAAVLKKRQRDILVGSAQAAPINHSEFLNAITRGIDCLNQKCRASIRGKINL